MRVGELFWNLWPLKPVHDGVDAQRQACTRADRSTAAVAVI